MENSDGQPLGHGEDFDLDADHATPEVKEIVSENDPEVFFSICRAEHLNMNLKSKFFVLKLLKK